MKKIIFAIITATVIMNACFDDIGNYDYHDVNEIEISGINDRYEVLDRYISIFPEINSTLSQNEDSYSFAWIVLRSNGRYDTIATTRNLDNHRLTLPTAATPYLTVFRVSDNETGLSFEKRFEIIVRDVTTTGFFVMSEIEGMMRLDFLSWFDNTYHPMYDILEIYNSQLPPQQGPIKIVNFADGVFAGGRAIFLLTQTGTNRIHQNTFDFQPSFNIRNHFINPAVVPQDFKADNIFNATPSVVLLYGDDKLFITNPTALSVWSYDDPLNSFDGFTYFKPSQHISGNQQGFAGFDDDSKSFFFTRIGGNLPIRAERMPEGQEVLTKYNNTDMELVSISTNYAYLGGIALADLSFYSIMKDNNDDYWVFRFLARATSNAWRQEEWKKIDLANATDIDKATHFATGGQWINNIYYAVDGKVYQYNIPDNASYLMLDKGDEKITFLDFVPVARHGETSNSDGYRLIFVGSYNETTGTGTLGHYFIPELQQEFVLYTEELPSIADPEITHHNEHLWTGFGKIVSVTFK